VKHAVVVAMVVVLAALASVAGRAAWLAPASAGGAWVPPDDTIVRVRGTAESGFTVRHYDGTAVHLPTLSEADAECTEYQRHARRVRCRAEVGTWYRDLGATKRALRYARSR
jgi:hypothetical protein